MTVHSTSRNFKANVKKQLANEDLQAALNKSRGHFVDGRATARDNLPEFDDLRDQARDIKDHTLEHLDFYLEAYEERVRASGGHVHWARTAEDAQRIVIDICRSVGAKQVNKGKTMIGEEIEINKALEADGIRPIETDLGEYIIQLRGELPSHIIAPAVHLTKTQVETSFRENHTELDPERVLEEPLSLLDEARTILRKKYFEAEVGITGANLLIAETGSSIIVTNEGNGDLSQLIPKVHIVLASLEKIVPTLEDAATILRVLARSATGQEFSSYTTLSTGPKREDDPDGPEQYHVVLLDNGRTDMLGTARSISRSGATRMAGCIRGRWVRSCRRA
jgi:L-lactate dehydrogenase complex protein LldF